MATFTANKQGSIYIRRRKFFVAFSIIYLIGWIFIQIYFYKWPSTSNLPFLAFKACSMILVIVWLVYYDFISIPTKCNRIIQSIEYGNNCIKLKTFPFRTFLPPRNLRAIEFTLEQNKLEIRKTNYWTQFSNRELFIILHEGKKYYLAPYYFDDFDSMVHTIPFVKVETAG
jgi:hypothetical protein